MMYFNFRQGPSRPPSQSSPFLFAHLSAEGDGQHSLASHVEDERALISQGLNKAPSLALSGSPVPGSGLQAPRDQEVSRYN